MEAVTYLIFLVFIYIARSSFPSIIGRVVVDSKPIYQAVVVMAFQFENKGAKRDESIPKFDHP